MRPFICEIEGAPLGIKEVDVSACMAFVLGALLERNGVAGKDVRRFIKLSQEPSFYANMAHSIDYEEEGFKKEFLVMLNEEMRHKKRREAYQLFKGSYPTVAAFIDETNKKDNSTLYKLCAGLESKIMINGAYKRLLAYNIPVFSIHDGLLTTPDNVGLVERMVKKAFRDELGRVPVIKIK